ncbi:TetR/AcrR family transcriptional regulator [Catellatospora tritici]|uniref:TetR/AcrR family transcriptional regulator n=1 Tax=Catellatospora tritici TaxID=2851566 RepID=UPI001C2DC7E1|nr:TetR/AcrR family transcriptional regulator [Catellatospora tritici]MBV1854297.1 TetR/AcrR family transcriptional regulator [Catellatospora tritici]
MPRLWDATIDAHRGAVREAVLDATAALVAAHGVASVTMSQIAEASGIGRATLYKYFPDVDAILRAWHERQVGVHLQQLSLVRQQHAGQPGPALSAALDTYAHICQTQHGAGPVAAALHQGDHMAHAHTHLRELVTALIADAAQAGQARTDVPAAELAGFCLSALQAASGLSSKAGVGRLVAVTLAGLRPPVA